MARLIPHALLQAAAWKNGGGSTTEIAVFPPGAGFADFDWRISLAAITQSGSFSLFPGIDRSLALVQGASLCLQVDGAPVTLDAGAPALRFAGEASVHASVSAASTDFNVMTRRGRCSHTLERLAAPARLTRRGATTLLFLASGAPVTVGRQFLLSRYDALLLDAGDASAWHIDAAADASLLVVELFFQKTSL